MIFEKIYKIIKSFFTSSIIVITWILPLLGPLLTAVSLADRNKHGDARFNIKFLTIATSLTILQSIIFISLLYFNPAGNHLNLTLLSAVIIVFFLKQIKVFNRITDK